MGWGVKLIDKLFAAQRRWERRNEPVDTRTPLQKEIAAVRHAILRYQSQRAEYYRTFLREQGSCCVDCMFGSNLKYRALRDQMERTENWLSVLEQKEAARGKG